MKNPNPKSRAFGQRSLASSFLNRSSMIPMEEGSAEVDKCASSFSEFLDSKLNKSVLFKLKSVEEGPTPFTSLVISPVSGVVKNGDAGLEKTMLQQFKPKEIQLSEEISTDVTGQANIDPLDQTSAEELDYMTSSSTEINEDIIVKDNKISKKRKDPFEGMEGKNRMGRPVIVFGDNAKVTEPIQRERERESNKNSQKQRAAYNHYANGSGWWDSEMEGVDSEEVGHSEVWEGVGSTTFGDIVDWH